MRWPLAGSPPNRQALLNTRKAAYLYNFGRFVQWPATASGNESFARNGVEMTSDWKPTRWWQLKGSYSYWRIDLENTLASPDIFEIVDTHEGSSARH